MRSASTASTEPSPRTERVRTTPMRVDAVTDTLVHAAVGTEVGGSPSRSELNTNKELRDYGRIRSARGRGANHCESRRGGDAHVQGGDRLAAFSRRQEIPEARRSGSHRYAEITRGADRGGQPQPAHTHRDDGAQRRPAALRRSDGARGRGPRIDAGPTTLPRPHPRQAVGARGGPRVWTS